MTEVGKTNSQLPTFTNFSSEHVQQELIFPVFTLILLWHRVNQKGFTALCVNDRVFFLMMKQLHQYLILTLLHAIISLNICVKKKIKNSQIVNTFVELEPFKVRQSLKEIMDNRDKTSLIRSFRRKSSIALLKQVFLKLATAASQTGCSCQHISKYMACVRLPEDSFVNQAVRAKTKLIIKCISSFSRYLLISLQFS